MEPSHWNRDGEAWRRKRQVEKGYKGQALMILVFIRRFRGFQWGWDSALNSALYSSCRSLLVIPQVSPPALTVLHCFLFLMLCSLKPRSNSVLSRNVFGLTKCGYSKDSSVILCSLHSRVNLNFCNRYADQGGLWCQFWHNGPLLFCTLST